MSAFAAYLIGFIVLIIGLAYAAVLAHVPPVWIGVGVVVLLGAGIVGAATRTKSKDPPAQ